MMKMKCTIIVLLIVIVFCVLTYNYAMAFEREFKILQVDARELSYDNVATKSPIVLENFNEENPTSYLKSMFILYRIKEEQTTSNAFQVRSNYILIVPSESTIVKLVHPSQLATHPALRVNMIWTPDQVEQQTHVDVLLDKNFALMVPCWWVVSCPTKCNIYSINSWPMVGAVTIANLL